MYNDILTIGPLSIHGYGLMIKIGVIVALVVAAKRVKKEASIQISCMPRVL